MQISNIADILEGILSPVGIETYPFKISWYNERVPDVFKFPYHPDTLCFVAISTPSTFEKAFLPFVLDNRNSSVKDPYDQCMTACFARVKQAFAGEQLELIQDFELHPNRRPKVIMQTAGHIAGAVHYYSCQGMHFDELPAKKKLLGVCIHPKFGGWFALRGVLIFRDVLAPKLQRRQPKDVIRSDAQRTDLVRLFNFFWRDGRYRDVIDVEERYSPRQQEYFNTLPSQRWKLIEEWRREASSCGQISADR